MPATLAPHRSTSAISSDDDLYSLTPPAAVSRLLDEAIALGASDLFLSADRGDWAVTLRHHGIIRPVCRLPDEMGRHCVSHLRAEADMDFAEHHHPHDGRMGHLTAKGRLVDVRICSLPTMHGEDLALRLLDRATGLLELDQLGLLSPDLARMKRMLAVPGGLILFTGPTGSGKSTTMYACLQHLNDGRRRIHTIEDPIEYSIAGLHQSQVNAKSGLRFADLLKAIVRQGPDVVMIGEIRDPETAQTAVAAANSGHQVLATLHAAIAAGSVQSLLGFDVSPHFLASSLLGAVSQRLVRTFCPHCRFPIEAEATQECPEHNPDGLRVVRYGAMGCEVCHHTGFGGRTGVFEIMEASPRIRELIQSRQPAQAIEAQACAEGMSGMYGSAQALIAEGRTEASELDRVLPVSLR